MLRGAVCLDCGTAGFIVPDAQLLLLDKATPRAQPDSNLTDGGKEGVQSFSILVVEDFEGFRRFVCAALQEKSEFQIELATDGLEAVRKAKELQPDLVLLDIGLPGLNGIDAAKQIRKLAPLARIVFVSQESSLEVVREALILGASGYVHKPHAGSDLMLAIESAFRSEQFLSPALFATLPSKLSSLSLRSALSEVVALAIAMVKADMGNLQILNHQSDRLHIAAHHGFSRQFLEFFDEVEHNQGSCGTSLAHGQRVIVDDVSTDPIFFRDKISGGRSGGGDSRGAVHSPHNSVPSSHGCFVHALPCSQTPASRPFSDYRGFAEGVAELIQLKALAAT